jgi:hypothetical protein
MKMRATERSPPLISRAPTEGAALKSVATGDVPCNSFSRAEGKFVMSAAVQVENGCSAMSEMGHFETRRPHAGAAAALQIADTTYERPRRESVDDNRPASPAYSRWPLRRRPQSSACQFHPGRGFSGSGVRSRCPQGCDRQARKTPARNGGTRPPVCTLKQHSAKAAFEIAQSLLIRKASRGPLRGHAGRPRRRRPARRPRRG